MDAMVAGDVAVLAYDPESGRPRVSQYKVDAALTAAVVLDLILTGVVKLEDSAEVRGARRFTDTAVPVSDELLADVVARLRGKKLKQGIQSVHQRRGGRLREAVLAQLVASGELQRREGAWLGILPRVDHPAGNGRRAAQVRARVAAALDGPLPPDQRTTALLGVLSAADLLTRLFPERDRATMKARVKELTNGDWVGETVKAAIQAVEAAGATAAVAVL